MCFGGSNQERNMWINMAKRQFKQVKPRDIIALVILVGGLMLKLQGYDGVVSLIIVSVVAYYFGLQRPSAETLEDIAKKTPQKNKEVVVEKDCGSVEGIIRRVCDEQGVDSDLAVRVAKAESGLNPEAKNINTTGSVDRGVFQWNDRWHPEVSDECAYDVECATRKFCKAVKNGNLQWWDATRDSWEN